MQDFLQGRGLRFRGEIVLDGSRESMLHFPCVANRAVALATLLLAAFFATTNGVAQSDNGPMAPDPQIAASLRQVFWMN